MVAVAKRAERREGEARQAPVPVAATVATADSLETTQTQGGDVARERSQRGDRVASGYVRGPGRKPRRKRR
jgi:hypothetical protein